MSRVERSHDSGERRRSDQQREAVRGRGGRSGPVTETPKSGPTPGKAEGEVGDVEKALEHQSE